MTMADTEFLGATELFDGTAPDEIGSMLGCLGAHEKRFSAGERIHRMGDHVDAAGVVLSGRVRIESIDAWGNVSVIGACEAGDMFGEVYAAVPNEPLMVDVVAAEDAHVLFVSVARVLATCPVACPHHAHVSRNMVHHRPKEPGALAPHLACCAEDATRESARLPERPIRTRGVAILRHTLQPPAARGLPGLRPLRLVGGTIAHGRGGAYRHAPQSFRAVAIIGPIEQDGDFANPCVQPASVRGRPPAVTARPRRGSARRSDPSAGRRSRHGACPWPLAP